MKRSKIRLRLSSSTPLPGVVNAQLLPPSRSGLRPVQKLLLDLEGEYLDGAGPVPLPILVSARRLLVDHATAGAVL